ncbi:MAG: peptidylprolyl isomerase, partial [Crocinitomicaceae bacterium]
MKKTIFLLLCLLFFNNLNAQSDPSVMEVNGQKVSKSEFLQIYLKNNNDPKFDKASIDEYMELFTKFKLKVAEAERLGYDTIPRLKKELEGYRKQLALPYLIDSVENKAMVRESYDRLKKEIRASHILIKVNQNASPRDTLKAYNRLLELKKRIEDGEAFEVVARSKNSSQDPSVMKNGGDLGFFTAFQMLYSFEEMAYNTQKGEVSDPFRTKYGYHILQVTDSRPARGTIRVAHLMVATPQGTTEAEIVSAEKKINEIYEKLKESNSDEDWENLVSKYSDDPSSAKKGGVLPIFGSGTAQRMVPVFEDAAFALKEDGAISAPVRTDYGFHILKRLEWNDIKSFDDLTAQQQEQRELDQRISVIADFVEKTGRDPRDWFVYQSMNPSEMDDVTAIQIQMSTEYPNLSSQEVNMLVSSKYKIDPDLHSEEEVQLSRLQMKIDAENARKGIDEMRLQYQAPLQEQSAQESLIDDNWVSNMRSELDAMDGIEFDLGNGSNFTFGIDGNYKNQLAEKNTRLDEFFDPYVREDGSWDYDMLNMHRAVIDNVDKIVQSVYKQGMADA